MPYVPPVQQDEYNATVDLQCISVYIPDGDEYKALLAGFIALLSDVRMYADPDSVQAEGIAATFDEGFVATNWDGCGVPPECEQMGTEITVSPITMDVQVGNAITANFTASGQRDNVAYAQSAAINGQLIDTLRYMSAGSWRYRITSIRTPASGILQIRVTSPVHGAMLNNNHDLYVAGANQTNQYQTGTFTVIDNERCSISLAANGKNASSAGYSLFISWVEMWRVG